MTLRNDRLTDVIFSLASEEMFSYLREVEHPYGLVSVVKVTLSKDRSEAIIALKAEHEQKEFIKFLEPIKNTIRRRLGKDFSLFKAPKIRFARATDEKEEVNLVSLIEELSAKYELNK